MGSFSVGPFFEVGNRSMSSQNDEVSQDDPRLNEILAQYLQAVEVGEAPDPEQLLSKARDRCSVRFSSPQIATRW